MITKTKTKIFLSLTFILFILPFTALSEECSKEVDPFDDNRIIEFCIDPVFGNKNIENVSLINEETYNEISITLDEKYHDDNDAWRQVGHKYYYNFQYEDAMKAYLRGGYEELAGDMKRKLSYIEVYNKIKNKCSFDSKLFEDKKECLKKTFYLNEEPVNPKIIEDIVGLMSDQGGIINLVNIEDGNRSNKYCCKYEYDAKLIEDDMLVTIYHKNRFDKRGSDEDENNYFQYKFLGTTSNGTIVLETYSRGGGTIDTSATLLLKAENIKTFHRFTKNNDNKIEFIFRNKLGLKFIAYFWGYPDDINFKKNRIKINDKWIELNIL